MMAPSQTRIPSTQTEPLPTKVVTGDRCLHGWGVRASSAMAVLMILCNETMGHFYNETPQRACFASNMAAVLWQEQKDHLHPGNTQMGEQV